MDKKIIKDYLKNTFISEEVTPAISIAKELKKKNTKANSEGVKDIEKNVSKFEKGVKADPNANQMAPNKFSYESDFEKTYHDQMEIMNGQEMLQYDLMPGKNFTERAEEAIAGSSRMGNNPEWANVVEKQKGFEGPDFGKNLVKKIKASVKKRSDDTPTLNLRGRDIQADIEDTGHRPYAIEENNQNNKKQIKESMKRLNFKKEFKGLGNALKLIPEAYKVDSKVFEMTDGNESYKIRWEGSLKEGKAVVLMASDKNLVNEDILKMKKLMSYNSESTLGIMKGNARLNENKIFGDMLSKTKSLMTESEDMEGHSKPKEKHWDEETKSAPEASKHVKASVKKDPITKGAKASEGNLDDAVSHAPEAKKHMSSSTSASKGTTAPKPKEGHWEEINVAHASEAKKHIHMKESEMEEKVMDENEMTDEEIMNEVMNDLEESTNMEEMTEGKEEMEEGKEEMTENKEEMEEGWMEEEKEEMTEGKEEMEEGKKEMKDVKKKS
jgi:hypothetical protein